MLCKFSGEFQNLILTYYPDFYQIKVGDFGTFRVPGRILCYTIIVALKRGKGLKIPEKYWEIKPEALLTALGSRPEGLTEKEAQRRLKKFGPNLLKKKKKVSRFSILLSQFKNPIILILIFAVIISAVVGDFVEGAIILAIIGLSGFLSFIQEYNAANAVEKLLEVVKTRVSVIRDGRRKDVLQEEIVPGDIISLSAGSRIPADCVILEAKDFFVSEAILTGETFPVEKAPGVSKEAAQITQRNNCVFMGTNVMSGTAAVAAVLTGGKTELGKVAGRLTGRAEETDFEKGIRHFGYFLLEVTLMLVIIVFAVNVYFENPVIDALMFSLALAVGLTPQLLPAIISVNLAKGSQEMSKKDVIVKRLASIENFGTMDVLCTDKTGTLTEGTVYLHDFTGMKDGKDKKIFFYAYLNAYFQTGLKNPIDEAIIRFDKPDISGREKIDEIPYDFERKRLSVIIKEKDANVIVSKGALKNIITICKTVEINGKDEEITPHLEEIDKKFNEWSERGFRVLGLAYKKTGEAKAFTKDDESDMTFLGFLFFLDPPKSDAKELVSELNGLGIEVKIITGDNRFIAKYVAESVGFPAKGIITGDVLDRMSQESIIHACERNNIFAEVDPIQKEKIILSLKKLGHVVGFLGDGINDAAAIHAADVGISVNTAVDVAKDAADIVLLERGLETLRDGVMEGRKTFANTIKYVFMATSANFGNMFSVAGASLFLPFLPMLPKQILLTNLLTDFPELTISTDSVDKELIEKPRRWDIRFIKRFMVFFGVISSVFDYVTFGVLLYVLKADANLFRTGWFVESVISATVAVTILRTRKAFFKSRPGKYLLMTTALVIAITAFTPYMPFSGLLGFVPVPARFLEALALILLSYILLIEAGKHIFYKKLVNGTKI